MLSARVKQSLLWLVFIAALCAATALLVVALTPRTANSQTSAQTATFPITASLDDQFVAKTSSGYPPSNAASYNSWEDTVWAERSLHPGGNYEIVNGLLRFNTSNLPDDATITGARLQVDIVFMESANGLSLTGDWFNWAGSNAEADYSAMAQTGAIAPIEIGYFVSGPKSFELLNASTNISKTGTSSLRLHIDGGPPTGMNYVKLASWNHETAAEPKLVVNYTTDQAPPPPSGAEDVGYRDFSYDAASVVAPTGQKPQSKLWFNDGTWWGSLFNRSAEEHHIYRYDRATHTWSDTATVIDERNSSKADVLWDGSHLYVATAGPTSASSHSGRVVRYSYDAATKKYSLEPGFPVTVTSGGMEAIVLDKDTTGRLWVSYTQNNQVYVNHSLGDDQSWGTPFVLPVTGTTVSADDISGVVAFDSQIGVMWSNQVDDAMYFATHTDGDPDNVWQGSRTAIQGPKTADDHISLRSLQADDVSGKVFAGVKTSLGDLNNPDTNAPLILLLVRDQAGNWTNYRFGRVIDHHTRPIVMIDQEHRNLYMFATAPETSGTIYYKKTPLSNISFSEGLGTPFIQSTTDTHINNATSTKQNVNSATGLPVLASDDTSKYYWHNIMDLGDTDTVDTTDPQITITTPPQGATYTLGQSVAASYDCTDADSGVASCEGPVADGANIDTSSTGTKTFTVDATDKAGNINFVSHTYTVNDPTTPGGDTTPPTVVSTVPGSDATGVSPSINNVKATFSEAMDASTTDGDPSTITATTFMLFGSGSTTQVAAKVSYDSGTRTAKLNPNNNLRRGVTYRAVLTTGVQDVAGNPLVQQIEWLFTVKR